MADPQPIALLIDFDGTAAQKNVGMSLIRAFARDDSWMVIDNDYERGRVGSRTAYQLMGPILTGDAAAWREFALKHHGLDPGFSRLVELARQEGWLVEILSDGLDLYIDTLLDREGVKIEVRSARVGPAKVGIRVSFPFINPLCGRCGTCKSERISELSLAGYRVIFVGDGLSDLCAAPKAARIFAKDVLASHLEEKEIPFDRYDDMDDIIHALFKE